ncbi:hypothetical protein [Nesterenkonia sandarakina]|uniref:Uncharacterized membrane protein YsdA (DUF1294 family) n=1 Tax=Nesterenkonia sandarakina TaxID=272918 RepID=A0A7Z0EAS1_9MICC|nr:hypothetical protein [Nesterenkonia sandarakina]NYJ18144.1 uncharacterized membrane protein YsdA (DUF1294 family) [Nesterenkonia sandarakina]
MRKIPDAKIRIIIYHVVAAALFVALVTDSITAQQVNEYLYVLTLILGIGGVEVAARTAKLKTNKKEDFEDKNG